MSRYSQLYIERGPRSPDSKRVRRRLCALCAKLMPQNYYIYLANTLELEFGITNQYYSYDDIKVFFDDADIEDILD